jgi:molybdenum-dependent DNA-binding transcriptional regulator ModE
MKVIYPETTIPFRNLAELAEDKYSYYTLRQMLVFSYLVATGSIDEAATKNRMSAQAVINNCNKLSKALGEKVIEKRKGDIYVTPFGKGVGDSMIPLLRELQSGLGDYLMPRL